MKCFTSNPSKLSSSVLVEIPDEELACPEKTAWSLPATSEEWLEPLGERLTGQYPQTLAQETGSEHLRTRYSLSDSSASVKSRLCFIYDLHITASIWPDPACHLVYNSSRIKNNTPNEYIFLAGWNTQS